MTYSIEGHEWITRSNRSYGNQRLQRTWCTADQAVATLRDLCNGFDSALCLTEVTALVLIVGDWGYCLPLVLIRHCQRFHKFVQEPNRNCESSTKTQALL